MASFTGVGDNVELQMADKGDEVLISLSGTYNMTIAFQREMGAPGSGAWETLRTYTTANATVSETHITEKYNEKVRLIVLVDTSGTCTATIADNLVKGHDYLTIKDRLGNTLVSFDQSGMSLSGSFRAGEPISVTTATITLTTLHAGRVVVLDRAAGVTVTLPAALGTGDEYLIAVGTTVTSNADIVQVANATDALFGGLAIASDIAGVVENTAANDDTITMNGTTTGGVKGSWVRVRDVAAGVWVLDGFLVSSGAEATPYSAGVS